ncbi:MAG TPA: MBG domain-containing protein, partial [Mycobacteriales bacterium]|nr:MBG domain-containing protein [Mycobacteriales bacterium]
MIEFVATFSGTPFEHAGLGAIDGTSTTFNSPPWAIFTTGSDGTTLSARTTLNVGSNESITNIGSAYLNAPHLFRIMWTSTSATYFVDDLLIAQHSFPPPGPAAPSASDFVVDGNSVRVDWVHMSPYAASTTFTSRVFDANGPVAWGALAWTADTPAGTSLTMRVHTGNTPTPDATWTPFAVVGANGGAIGTTARYVQYKADLRATDPSQTPVVYDVTIGFPGLAATRIAPTITWNNPADITYGTALGASQLNATANVPGTFAYSPAAGTILGAGPNQTLSVTFTPTDTVSYSTVTSHASINVLKATASVTPAAASKTYGATDPTFTGTLTGFLARDAVTASYSRTAGETVAGGPYTISAVLSPATVLTNYTITYNTAAFTINKVTASVTPAAASKTYGAADPTFTGTLSGFLASDAVTATYSRTAGESVAGGPYTISATLSPATMLTNYTITYNTATFTINKATASVTPAAASKTYGTIDPAFTGTLSGFLASDAVTASYSRTAGETVAGGPYTISAVLSPAAVLTNYTITYNTAAFTINKAAASVTPASATKVYGASDPVLTGTPSGFLASDAVTATYSRTAGETVAGSPYVISATLSPAGVLGNYQITFKTASFTITKGQATVTAPTSSNASTTYGDAVTFTASVLAVSPSGGIPTGTITFNDNGVPIPGGTAVINATGQASVTVTGVNAGSRLITATYSGDSNFFGSGPSVATTQTVAQATGTATMTVSALTPQYSDSDTFTATFTPSKAGGPAPAKINFKVGTQVLPDVTPTPSGGNYVYTWTGQMIEPSPFGTAPTGQMKPGSRTVTAAFTDPNFSMTNPAKLITIRAEDARVAYGGPTSFALGAATGTVTLNLTVKDITAMVGDPASDATAGDIRNAQVQFFDRGTNTILGTVNVSSGADTTVGTATFN